MNNDFATAMGRALEQTRAGNPAEATRAIQDALNRPHTARAADTHMDGGSDRPGADPKTRYSFGKVVNILAEGRKGAAWMRAGSGGATQAARPDIPDGATYQSHRHDCAFGSRDYCLFVPSPRPEPVQGVVLMLHGCTQTADDFATGTQMNVHGERQNLIVVYPQQDRSDNAMACWNWFRPGDQAHGAGEPAFLADLALAVATAHNVGRERIFAGGLSAGGAMAAILGQTYPEVFQAVAVHSGLAPGSARDVTGAYAAMQGNGAERQVTAPVRTIVFHGDADRTVDRSNADSVLRAALGRAVSVEVEMPSAPASSSSGRAARCTMHRTPEGRVLAESWTIKGAGHAWSGGAASGSYTDPAGPDASAEMVRFFLAAAADGPI